MNGILKEITAVLYKSVGTTLYAKCDYAYTQYPCMKQRASTAICLVWPFLSFGIRY